MHPNQSNWKACLQEAEEKAEGEAALNEMFQKIYADASDEVTGNICNSLHRT